MPIFEITAPDGRTFRVTAPDGASKQDALARVQAQYADKVPDQPMDPTGSFTENLAAGAGKALTDIWRGAKQIVGAVPQSEIDEARRLDAPLMKTAGGVTGNIAGNLAVAVPTALIPGANTYTGAAALGGVLGALQPTAEGESRLTNTAIGVGGGVVAKAGMDKLGQALSSRLSGAQAGAVTAQAQNAERDAVLAASKKAGYIVPPSSVNPSGVNQALEGISGKIKTAQVASQRNQTVTNNLARDAVGLAKDEPLTEAALNTIRKDAGKAYEAIKSFPQKFAADAKFSGDIKAIGNDFSAAASEFPEIAGNPAIDTLKTALDKTEISPRAAVELIKKLRFDANKNFKAFDDPAKAALATAQKDAANAIEDLIERQLSGTDLLKNFRQARELIAKTYSVEAAMQGADVSATRLASQLSKRAPLTGPLKTAADFAQQFPKAAQALKEPPGAVSPLDFALAFGTGNPAAMAARPAIRAGLLSKPYQGMVAPNYTPNALLRMGAPVANNAFVKQGAIPLAIDAAN